MAMNLFAHVLRGEKFGTEDWHAAARSIDPRRWAVRDLVVRRFGFASWGLSNPAPPKSMGATPRDPAAEPLWADTQPWCHE